MMMERKKKALVAVVAGVMAALSVAVYLGWDVIFGTAVMDKVHAAAEGEGGASTAKSETAGVGEKIADASKKDKSTGKEIGPGALEVELMMEVEKRQKALDAKEEELKQKEERVAAMQLDIDKQLNELKVAQAQIEELVKQRADLEDAAVAKLAKTYSSMPPENAAALIRQMDPGLSTRVLSAMKERNAARIMAALPADTATKLSETLVKRK